MNFPSRSTTGKTNEPNQRFKSRLTFDDKLYKSASEALEAYITQFEGGRSYTTYRRRPSDLLSPTPKFYFMDAQERYLRSPPGKSPAKKVDELLAWVNNAYAKDLTSKVTPFGYRTTTGRPRSSGKLFSVMSPVNISWGREYFRFSAVASLLCYQFELFVSEVCLKKWILRWMSILSYKQRESAS